MNSRIDLNKIAGLLVISTVLLSTLFFSGYYYRMQQASAYTTSTTANAIPPGIKITGDVNNCLSTVNDAFAQLNGLNMKVATTYNYLTGQWNYVIMSDSAWVDSLTDTINCDYATDHNYGWMYTNISYPHLIHVSHMAFSSDNGYTHINHIKDFAAALTHETRHEEQMKTWVYNYNPTQWNSISRQTIEWDAMKVQAGVLRALQWTNNESVEGSYETFLHYRYDCSVYHVLMPLSIQNQLGFTIHLYTNPSSVYCNPNDWQDPSLTA